jgi:hypothetical protein
MALSISFLASLCMAAPSGLANKSTRIWRSMENASFLLALITVIFILHERFEPRLSFPAIIGEEETSRKLYILLQKTEIKVREQRHQHILEQLNSLAESKVFTYYYCYLNA